MGFTLEIPLNDPSQGAEPTARFSDQGETDVSFDL